MSSLVVVIVVTAIVVIGAHHLWLVALILLVVAALFIWLTAAVMRQAQRDPTGLMLGRVTGDEYRQIRALNMGDSSEGERRVVGLVADPVVVEATASDDAELPRPTLGPGGQAGTSDAGSEAAK